MGREWSWKGSVRLVWASNRVEIHSRFFSQGQYLPLRIGGTEQEVQY